jgi:hypothetical protein
MKQITQHHFRYPKNETIAWPTFHQLKTVLTDQRTTFAGLKNDGIEKRKNYMFAAKFFTRGTSTTHNFFSTTRSFLSSSTVCILHVLSVFSFSGLTWGLTCLQWPTKRRGRGQRGRGGREARLNTQQWVTQGIQTSRDTQISGTYKWALPVPPATVFQTPRPSSKTEAASPLPPPPPVIFHFNRFSFWRGIIWYICTVYIQIQCTRVSVPSSELGPPPPPSTLGPKGGGQHSLAGEGVGEPNSDD